MTFEPSITWGNLITILAGLVSVVALWVRLGERVERVEKDHEKQSAVVEEIMKLGLITNQANHERRIRELEEAFRKFHQMETDIRWIKQSIRHPERINDKNDTQS